MKAAHKAFTATLAMGIAFFGLASVGVAQDIHAEDVEIADFDWESDSLSGYADGRTEADVFALVEDTNFVVGSNPKDFPPEPCKGLAANWNNIAENVSAPESTRQSHFRVLLEHAAEHACMFHVVSNSAGEVVSLYPVP